MPDNKAKRLSKIAREFNVGITTIVDYLNKKGVKIDSNPNTKIQHEQFIMLEKQFKSDINAKKQSEEINLRKSKEGNDAVISEGVKENVKDKDEQHVKSENFVHVKNLGTSQKKKEVKQNKNEEIYSGKKEYKVVGKIDLDKNGRKVVEKNETPSIEEETPVKSKEKVVELTETVKERNDDIKEKKDNIIPKKETLKANNEDFVEKAKQKVVEDKKNPVVVNTEEKEQKQEKQYVVKTEKQINETTDEKKDGEIKVVGKINLDNINQKTRPDKKTRKQRSDERKEKSVRERKVKDVSQEQKTPKEEVPSLNEVPINVVEKEVSNDFLETKVERLAGPTVVGKIILPSAVKKKPVASSSDKPKKKRKKRKRITKNPNELNANTPDNQRSRDNQNKDQAQKTGVQKTDANKPGQQRLQGQNNNNRTGQNNNRPGQNNNNNNRPGQNNNNNNNNRPGQNNNRPGQNQQSSQVRDKNWSQRNKKVVKKEVNEEDVQKQIKETLARLTSGKKKSNKAAKYRRTKRDLVNKKQLEELETQEKELKILKVTEFVTVNELANMMTVGVTDIISTCMSLGLFVAINQRLDAETITLVAEEYDFDVEFVSVELQEAIEDVADKIEELKPRAPIVTVMGHVDHGKTSLLDYIRSENVIDGEAGGITQHIGAYRVKVGDNKMITFLDTPGHEAFTAMRARGANVTDIAIIVIAADDCVMPQTVEAINHAQAANVPIIFAINKIDKPGANSDKIKEELSGMNLLVEQWGGKYQSQDISAKFGKNIDELLEKVLLEAEMLELQANPEKRAVGSIIESTLDKGRGYVATILVQSGTLRVGDIILAGTCTGRVKAMYNEMNKPVTEVGPSEPVIILGLNGAPQAGDNFHIMSAEREARGIAAKRDQLQREQGLRSQKHITLDEIGRRIAVGNFQELNVIIKGDVDGSIEALADSFIKQSTDEIQVNVKHKAVGQINEADIMLAAASNSIIIGFQVRPSVGARKLAEKEGIDIRQYSIIYDAINDLKDAMQGMLAPELKEEILGTAEIRDVYKITKVGTIAGCIVKDGKILRKSKIRVIRDGIVVYTGELASLRRFKEDVREVKTGFECGLNVDRFNDIKVGDMIESFQEVEIERSL